MLVGVLMKQVAVALTLSCGMLGAEEGAHVSWRESAFGFRWVTAGAAGVVVPGMGAARASRWARAGP